MRFQDGANIEDLSSQLNFLIYKELRGLSSALAAHAGYGKCANFLPRSSNFLSFARVVGYLVTGRCRALLRLYLRQYALWRMALHRGFSRIRVPKEHSHSPE